jgi:hypothetical protein
MNKESLTRRTLTALILSTTALITFGCGKSVDLGELNNNSGNSPSTLDIQCGADEMARWDFRQPKEKVNRSVDLLFVVDTSDSLVSERSKLATTIPAFLNELSPQTDYRIGVMLAHGGASSYSGKLYSAQGTPKVLSSKSLSMGTIQANLSKTLSQSVADADEANGEALMYSFMKSMSGDPLALIKSQGFYRSEAALSTVFVTDENDICYRPDLHGFSAFPDFVSSYKNTEVTAYNRYCLNSNGSERVTPDAVITSLSAIKPKPLLSFGAIVHSNPAGVPKTGEDSIGHGILELVAKTASPVVMDIADANYSDGLAKLGNFVSRQISLDTSFKLTNAEGIRADTIRVAVDGRPVRYQFDSSQKVVQLETQYAGQAESEITVVACKPR